MSIPAGASENELRKWLRSYNGMKTAKEIHDKIRDTMKHRASCVNWKNGVDSALACRKCAYNRLGALDWVVNGRDW